MGWRRGGRKTKRKTPAQKASETERLPETEQLRKNFINIKKVLLRYGQTAVFLQSGFLTCYSMLPQVEQHKVSVIFEFSYYTYTALLPEFDFNHSFVSSAYLSSLPNLASPMAMVPPNTSHPLSPSRPVTNMLSACLTGFPLTYHELLTAEPDKLAELSLICSSVVKISFLSTTYPFHLHFGQILEILLG